MIIIIIIIILLLLFIHHKEMGNCVASYRCTGIAALDRQNNIPLGRQDCIPFIMARKRNASKVTPRRPSRRVSISLSTLLGVNNSDPPNTSAGPLGTVAKNTASSKTLEQRGSSRRSVIKLKELREESVENNIGDDLAEGIEEDATRVQSPPKQKIELDPPQQQTSVEEDQPYQYLWKHTTMQRIRTAKRLQ